MKRGALWVVGLVLLAGCGRPKLVPYTPLEEKTDIEEKKLFDAVEGTMLDKGYLFQKRDEAAFHLLTKPRTLTGSEMTSTKYKYVWDVDTKGGTLKIQLKCQETTGEAEPVDCAAETPEKIVKEQQAIRDKALAEARGE
jgi:hypothetical protein